MLQIEFGFDGRFDWLLPVRICEDLCHSCKGGGKVSHTSILHVSERGNPFKFRLGPDVVCSTTEVGEELALQAQRLIVLVTQVILER